MTHGCGLDEFAGEDIDMRRRGSMTVGDPVSAGTSGQIGIAMNGDE